MPAKSFFTSVGVVLVMLGALPTSARTDPPSTSSGTDDSGVLVSADSTGDANFINGRGVLEGLEQGPDTRPASIDGADIERISFSTPYETVKSFGLDGTVERVMYQPRAFRVTIKTHGNVLPTFGPSLLFRALSRVESPNPACRPILIFQAWIRGPDSPVEHPQQAEIRPHAGPRPDCLPPVNSEFYKLSVDGDLITMEYPFDLLKGVLEPGVKLFAPPVPVTQNLRPSASVVYAYPNSPSGFNHSFGSDWSTVDESSPIETFWVGSDVPPDVICSQQPAHSDCQP